MVKKRSSNNRVETLLYVVIFLVLFLSVINVFLISTRFSKIDEAKALMEEMLRPGNLEVTKIILSDCEDCYNIDLILEQLKEQNVNVTKEITLTKEDAEELISTYSLDKLPVLFVKGEVNKSEQLLNFFNDNGKVIDNSTALFTKVNPPYYLINESKVVGRVSLTHIIDSLCENCTSLLSLTENLEALGVKITNEKIIDYNSIEGNDLIVQNNVSIIPAVIISDEIDYYEEVMTQLSSLELNKRNNLYTVHALTPPYRNLTDNNIVGLVEVIAIIDKSCTLCYDVNQNKLIVKRLGVTINTEHNYDISSPEAQELMQKYNITKVPMILLSPDASVYPTFLVAWKSVGVVEDDGWFVMADPSLLGVYKDLITNKVVSQTNE